MTNRYLPIDIFRGATLALMLVVNNPGSWSQVYSQLGHAGWHGLHLADLVFPFFLFIVGFSIGLSHEKHRSTSAIRIIVRFFIIFASGLLLNAIQPLLFKFIDSGFNPTLGHQFFSDYRYLGVLQRIAICYLVVSLINSVSPKSIKWFFLFFILAYQFFMRQPFSATSFDFSQANNFARLFDNSILGSNHIYKFGKGLDPEGLLSSLNAIAMTLSGLLCYQYWYKKSEKNILLLILGSFLLVAAGLMLSLIEPINKQLFTTSYVLLSSGLAAMMLAFFHTLPYEYNLRLFEPLIALGRNSFLIFTGSILLAKGLNYIQWNEIALKKNIYNLLNQMISPKPMASLLFSIFILVFFTSLCLALYRKRKFFVI